MSVTVNGIRLEFAQGERLVDLINRSNIQLSQVCYHPQLGPIETCDTCIVEADGKLVRACAIQAADGMRVKTNSSQAAAAQREAFDRILSNHLLYCTVCDNSNGNCTVHNTTKLLAIEHQEIPYKTKPYERDMSNPFYRYDPRAVHFVRALRGGVPEPAGERNAQHQLGRSASACVVGWRRSYQ